MPSIVFRYRPSERVDDADTAAGFSGLTEWLWRDLAGMLKHAIHLYSGLRKLEFSGGIMAKLASPWRPFRAGQIQCRSVQRLDPLELP